MQVGTGYCDNPDSRAAGQQAAKAALEKAGRTDVCDLVLLFCASGHNQIVLRQEVAEITGNYDNIFGGGASGIITNEKFGYAGNQVGVACIWMDGSSFEVIAEDGLRESELAAGVRIGRRLGEAGVAENSPVMLFYDVVDRTKGDLRILMATWLLEGIEKGLGFLPDMTGAGLHGDHVGSATGQYIGDKITSHSAFALLFSDDIQIDSIVMHGNRPASPYYKVTKADGPVILEIEGKRALTFIDEILDSSISQDEYPFFLLFGINHGERWGKYNEDNYASRLCLSIDKERGGIVMFEPDMVEGTEFQIMSKAFDLEYMQPKLDDFISKVEDDAIFAMYIDCAGRCAGYGGMDADDAIVIQNAIKDKIPLLGIYVGVEIASIGDRPRGLDWTGMLCVLSKKKGEKRNKIAQKAPCAEAYDAEIKAPCVKAGGAKPEKPADISLDAALELCRQNAAKILALDAQSIKLRHELEQKRRGFGLLAELAVFLRQGRSGSERAFFHVTKRINSALNMQKTVVLFPDTEGKFTISILQGYTSKEKEELMGCQPELDGLLNPDTNVLVTSQDGEEILKELREFVRLPYFISTPIIVRNELSALLITGRMAELPPFLARLEDNDVETVQAIGALLASVLIHKRLDDANKQAQSDVLTGLFNRGALELQAITLLGQEQTAGSKFAFIMIDFDYFKNINDSHGHLAGDEALKALAKALRKNFRSTDIVARIGGDEFAVFCAFEGDKDQLIQKTLTMIEKWNDTPITLENGAVLKATLSIGISITPKDGTTYNELFRKADVALYKSKQLGRNRLTVYDNDTMGEK